MFLSPYFSFKGIDCRNYFIMITTTDKDGIVEVGIPYKTNLTMENSFHYTEEDETPEPIELNLTLVDENRVPLKWTNEYFQNIKDWLISDDFEEFISYDNPEYVYSYDFYVANEDTGYAYKEEMNNLPYDYADGVDLKALAFSYDEFVEKSENMITMFIERNDKSNGYSLVEKANKPLLIW